jgi:hypothetical protein
MKKALLALAAVALATSSYAQGIITFYNNDLPVGTRTLTDPAVRKATDPTLYRAGIFQSPGVGAGAGFTAGLFLASNLDTPLAVQTFRLNNNFELLLTPQDVVVPGVAAGQTANFVVRAWETSAGSYANAAPNRRGEQAFTSDPLGGQIPGAPPAANATLSGFMGFVMVPEPSTLALGAIGLGAMMLRRRK